MNKCLCSNLNTQSLFGIFSFDRLPHYKMAGLMAGIKKVFSFYSCPVSLDQIYLVLVLTSANHNARNRYPEMDTARTVNCKPEYVQDKICRRISSIIV